MKFTRLSLLIFLFGSLSCSNSDLARSAISKVKHGASYVTEKSKQVYETTKSSIGNKVRHPLKVSRSMSISKRVFGKLSDGTKVHEFRIINENGMEVSVLEYGASIREIIVPDRNGQMKNVSLGFSNLQDYIERSPYFGCIAGRYANRIAKGSFALDGREYQLATNNGQNHLHGGDRGFDKRIWSGKPLQDGLGVVLTYRSPHDEEGYPGNLICRVVYSLSEDGKLSVEIKAQTDAPTIVNLTNHTYFNLAGEGDSTILDHLLTLPGSSYVATDETNIPIGLRSVAGSPMDFRHPTPVGSRINQDHEQLSFGKGYDHTWTVPIAVNEDSHENAGNENGIRHAATLHDPGSGRTMRLLTNQPGVQFYSGNYLDGSLIGDSGKNYPLRSGLCLEPQVFPDSPNHEGEKGWKSCILRPGDEYLHFSVYEFSSQ